MTDAKLAEAKLALEKILPAELRSLGVLDALFANKDKLVAMMTRIPDWLRTSALRGEPWTVIDVIRLARLETAHLPHAHELVDDAIAAAHWYLSAKEQQQCVDVVACLYRSLFSTGGPPAERGEKKND
jgi:hypothetical protein